MEQTPYRSNPAADQQANAYQQQHPGTLATEGQPSQNNPENADHQTSDPNKKPTPVEMPMHFWDFITRPEHANAIMAIFTVLIFLATTAYAVIALLQWKSMQGQLEQIKQQLPELQRSAKAAEDGAKLARQQAVALQQAVVKIWVSDFVLESPNLIPALPMALRNEGIAIATEVGFHGAFAWKSEPHHVTVGQPIPIDIEIPSMLQGDKGAKSYMLRIPELNQEKLKELRTSTKSRTVELSGKLTYSNGFDQVISESFCKIYFAHEQLGNLADAGFVDCDQYAAKVKIWENLEREHRAQH